MTDDDDPKETALRHLRECLTLPLGLAVRNVPHDDFERVRKIYRRQMTDTPELRGKIAFKSRVEEGGEMVTLFLIPKEKLQCFD